MNAIKTPIIRYSICVSGAAAGITVEADKELAVRLGAAIADSGHVLTTGATVGLPYYAAQGAKGSGGMSIGFSPAGSIKEHMKKYRLPSRYFDYINYTGMSYVGRDVYLVQSSDAVITVGGRFGSLHEFTTALEAGIPCGVLLGSGGAADLIPQLMDVLEPPNKGAVLFAHNPEELVNNMIAHLDELYFDLHRDIALGKEWYISNNHGSHSG